jgi:hypothetical protein
LSAGAALASRRTGPKVAPLRFYALLEVAIGVTRFLFDPIFVAFMNRAPTVWFAEATSPFVIHARQYRFSAAVILSPALLLGMTFPLMTVGFLRRVARTSGDAGHAIDSHTLLLGGALLLERASRRTGPAIEDLVAGFTYSARTALCIATPTRLVLAHAGWQRCSR